MKSHERAPRSFSKLLLTTGVTAALALSAALAAPAVALADEPAPPPAAAPAAEPAPLPAVAPAAEPMPAPAAEAPPAQPEQARPRPLPASVLAMVDHDVVIRLDQGPHILGHLISASDDAFEIRKPEGGTIRIPRSRVKGVRLSAVAVDPAPISQAEAGAGEAGSEGSQSFVFSRRERTFGFGTAFGGGFSGFENAVSGAFLLPTAELQIFFPREYSLDLSVPVLNMALGSALVGGTIIGGDLYFNVNAGTGKMRFVGGPGIGFAYVDIRGTSATSLKIPAQIGFESLSKKRSFGFKLVARPWLEIASGDVSGVGGGLMGAFIFSGYALSDRAPE